MVPPRLAALVLALVFSGCGGSYEEEPANRLDAGAPMLDGGTAPLDSGPPVAPADGGVDASPGDGGPGADASTPEVVPAGDLGSACLRLAAPITRAKEAHVVAVYTAEGTPPRATVNVQASDVTLVLASYDAVAWTVTLTPTASVARVVLMTPTANLDGVSATGLPAGVPITKRASSRISYGYSRERNMDGGGFTQQIGAIREELGGLETTYQGAYTGKSFSVGAGTPAAGIEAYDTRVACADPCARTGVVTAWANALGSNATINGLVATAPSGAGGANLRTANGVRCGKHYFEVQMGPTGYVGLSSLADYYPLSFDGSNKVVANAGSRVGVAVDLDANTVSYTVSGETASQVTLPLKLWYREQVGPAAFTNDSGTITLVRRAPFGLTRPAGFAADL